MTSTLHERLHRLADQVDAGVDRPAARDLWTRGRRYQRHRRTGTAVIAGVAAMLVVVIGAVTWQRSAPPPQPVPAGAPAGLPSRVHEAGPWLPGTDTAGPPGQVVAVLSAERGGWFGAAMGTVAISATTGEYRFLDLPDRADHTEVALAPDGRHLAYWLTGETTQTPNTNGDYQEVAAGVAVYDTLTGEVVRHPIETAHGLQPEQLAWVDDDSLLVDHLQSRGGDDDSDMDQSSYDYASALWWDLGADPRTFPAFDRSPGQFLGASTAGRIAYLTEDEDFVVLDGAGGLRRWPVGASMGGQGGIAVDPSGTRVAGVSSWGGRTPNRVATSVLPRDGESTDFTPLPRSDRSFRVLGWSDDRHLMVERRVGKVRDCLCLGVYEMDADTGASEVVVDLPEGSFYGAQWATGLLGAPVVDRPAPPTPLDPRMAAGLLVATVTAAGVALVLWRRRVRP